MGRHLVPMVEIVIQKPLSPNAGDDGAEHRGHPEQRHQALIQSDAAEASEGDKDEQADSKLDQDPGRLSRRGRCGQCCTGTPRQAKLSLQIGS
jgi:hypothetical protein